VELAKLKKPWFVGWFVERLCSHSNGTKSNAFVGFPWVNPTYKKWRIYCEYTALPGVM